jgi:hypothetical protein
MSMFNSNKALTLPYTIWLISVVYSCFKATHPCYFVLIDNSYVYLFNNTVKPHELELIGSKLKFKTQKVRVLWLNFSYKRQANRLIHSYKSCWKSFENESNGNVHKQWITLWIKKCAECYKIRNNF